MKHTYNKNLALRKALNGETMSYKTPGRMNTLSYSDEHGMFVNDLGNELHVLELPDGIVYEEKHKKIEYKKMYTPLMWWKKDETNPVIGGGDFALSERMEPMAWFNNSEDVKVGLWQVIEVPIKWEDMPDKGVVIDRGRVT